MAISSQKQKSRITCERKQTKNVHRSCIENRGWGAEWWHHFRFVTSNSGRNNFRSKSGKLLWHSEPLEIVIGRLPVPLATSQKCCAHVYDFLGKPFHFHNCCIATYCLQQITSVHSTRIAIHVSQADSGVISQSICYSLLTGDLWKLLIAASDLINFQHAWQIIPMAAIINIYYFTKLVEFKSVFVTG